MISLQQKDPNLVASYDNTVAEVQDVLETLLNQGQHAWVPYISTWSIKTLGVLSKKYKRSDNRGEQKEREIMCVQRKFHRRKGISDSNSVGFISENEKKTKFILLQTISLTALQSICIKWKLHFVFTLIITHFRF